MSFYPATVIALDAQRTTVCIDATGHVIQFGHDEHNAINAALRVVGTKGVVFFPKAPAQFEQRAA